MMGLRKTSTSMWWRRKATLQHGDPSVAFSIGPVGPGRRAGAGCGCLRRWVVRDSPRTSEDGPVGASALARAARSGRGAPPTPPSDRYRKCLRSEPAPRPLRTRHRSRPAHRDRALPSPNATRPSICSELDGFVAQDLSVAEPHAISAAGLDLTTAELFGVEPGVHATS